MMLLLDIGNSRAKLAWLPAGASRRRGAPIVLAHAQLAGLASRLPGTPCRVLASNVAGPLIGRQVEQLCLQAWGLAVEWHDARDGRHMLHNAYQQALQLGADRWLALLGLLHHVRDTPAWAAGYPCLLASFGTATTIDTLLPGAAPGVDAARFAGGLILPGPHLMASSLAQGTAQLPLAAGQVTDFPHNTHDAIASGVAAAQGGALLRQWRLALQAGAGAPQVYVSGGGWSAVAADVCTTLARAQADLHLPSQPPQVLDAPVLDGLASLALAPAGG